MHISLRAIDQSNYETCIALQVLDSQKNYVAENWYSLLQGLYEPHVHTLAIYDEEQMIGMMLYDYDEELQGWSMSRFMIDKNHQHKGYGKVALQEFLRYFKEKIGNVDLYTSAEVENEVAIELYKNFGFTPLNEFSYTHQGITFCEVRMIKKTEEKGK